MKPTQKEVCLNAIKELKEKHKKYYDISRKVIMDYVDNYDKVEVSVPTERCSLPTTIMKDLVNLKGFIHLEAILDGNTFVFSYLFYKTQGQ